MRRWSVDQIFHKAEYEMHLEIPRNVVEVGLLGDTEKHQWRQHSVLVATVAIVERHWQISVLSWLAPAVITDLVRCLFNPPGNA